VIEFFEQRGQGCRARSKGDILIVDLDGAVDGFPIIDGGETGSGGATGKSRAVTSSGLLLTRVDAVRDVAVPAGFGRYREIAPPARLRELVECFWYREPGVVRPDRRVLPDGCVDVIWVGGDPPVVAGPATRATVVGTGVGTEVVGVRFRPGAAPWVLGVSARELLDQHVPLLAIWSEDRAAGWLGAMESGTLEERLDGVSALIEERAAAGEAGDAIVRQVVMWIARYPRASIDEIAGLCGISERQLRRRFEQSVGYGPKTLQRILRLQRLLWLARGVEPASPGLARLAAAAGYADQPHMTREAVALTGATPRQLLLGSRLTSAVSDLFKTTTGQDATLALPG
jgi:AraC-like DNA-binding protein